MADISFDDAQDRVIIEGKAEFTDGDVQWSAKLKVDGDTLKPPGGGLPRVQWDNSTGQVRVQGRELRLLDCNLRVSSTSSSAETFVSSTGDISCDTLNVTNSMVVNGDATVSGEASFCDDILAYENVFMKRGGKIYLDSAEFDIMIRKSNGRYVSLRDILEQLGVNL